MIVRPDKSYEINSNFPNTNWYENEPDNFVVDETTEEGATLAAKIVAAHPFYHFVLDEKGRLIDIDPYEPTAEERNAIYPPPPKSPEQQRIEALEAAIAELTMLIAMQSTMG